MTNCLFCKIALGEIPTEVIYQDGDVVAFRDIDPQAPVHVLVIPRKHIAGFDHVTDADEALIGKMARAVAHVADAEGVADSGFRTVVNRGADALQSVDHLHMHVIGGRRLAWPPG